MHLHVATLAFCTALAGLMMCINMTVLYRASPRERCLLDWAVAGALFAVGNFFDTFVGGLPYALSPALTNATFIAAMMFIGQGVSRYLNLRPNFRFVLALAVVFYAIEFLPALHHSARLRISATTFFAMLFLLRPAYLLWHHDNEGTRVARMLVSAILFCYSGLLVIRAVGFFLQPEKAGFFTTEPIQVISYIIDICFVSSSMLACGTLVFRHQEVNLQSLVRIDPLTGLFNRFSLAEFVQREILRAQRYQTPLSVLVLDLDYFKRINDRYGHDGGDCVLKELAVCMRESLRDSDLAFRIGGEEFMAWLPNTDATLALQVAERMANIVRERKIQFAGQTIQCTASIGVAQWQAGDSHWERTFSRADSALYQAKAQGRDRVVCASTDCFNAAREETVV
jgi:diguanylate cyclase (GGDEF)-like protein